MATAPHLVVPFVGCRALAASDADTQAPRLPHDGERQLETEQTLAVWGLPVGLAGDGEGLVVSSSLGGPRQHRGAAQGWTLAGQSTAWMEALPCLHLQVPPQSPAVPETPQHPCHQARPPCPGLHSASVHLCQRAGRPQPEGGAQKLLRGRGLHRRAGRGKEAQEPTAPEARPAARDTERKAESTDLFFLNACGFYQQVIGLVKRHPLLGQDQRGHAGEPPPRHRLTRPRREQKGQQQPHQAPAA